MSAQRSNVVMVSLVAALVVPRIQQMTGIVLTIDDVAALIALAGVLWHAVAQTFERYFPPPIHSPFLTPEQK